MKGKELPEGKRGSLLQKVRKMQVKFQTSKGNSTFLKKDVFELSTNLDVFIT